MATTHLLIVTPESKRFEGDVEIAIAPGSAGDLAALPNHAPMLTTLRPGIVTARETQASATAADAATGSRFAIDGGFMQITPDSVIVLTDRAVTPGEVELESARAEVQRAREALAQKQGVDDSKERIALAFALAKLELTGRGEA
ncbi:MAG: ATP synthase F1 subunit epsilon [Candidatus Eremiobacteraeota bacterium]|nr:ATP synthase F1 subunit epsilon [Candidatus Eremiobacteraeota bacterium]MBV8281300.1 ATP synthase F1 subunit epsilon [Candidatus Eremiobacteraeota bacterium]